MVAKKEKKTGAAKASSGSVTTTARGVSFALLQRPILTEKTAMLSSDRNRVVFEVPKSASKTEIKAAVESVFKVQVSKIRTVNVLGKVKRSSKSMGRRASFKKAYVTVKEGQTIDIVEGL